MPVAVELAIYGLVVGLVRLSGEGSQYETAVVATHLVFRTVFPLVLLWLIVWRRRTIEIALLLQLALLFIITALVAISFFGGATSPVAVIASTCARTIVIILLWFTLALLAQRSNKHPYVVFGVGWALYMLSIAGGMVLGEVLHALQVFSDAFFLNLVYFLVVSTMLILGVRRVPSTSLLIDDVAVRASTRPTPQDFDLIDGRCKKLGELHGLTQREIEVMQLICKGRSKSYIADALSISENTVRSYAKNIYFKVGIHNRQALLSLVGIA
jgi:DNA-binding CsgD family transcriptional regulator